MELCRLKVAFSASYAAPDPLWVRISTGLFNRLLLHTFTQTTALGSTQLCALETSGLFFQLQCNSSQVSVPQNPVPGPTSPPRTKGKISSVPWMLHFFYASHDPQVFTPLTTRPTSPRKWKRAPGFPCAAAAALAACSGLNELELELCSNRTSFCVESYYKRTISNIGIAVNILIQFYLEDVLLQ